MTGNDNEDEYYYFLKTFKILGRYRYHKREALRLIRKKLTYPESQIREIALISGISEDEIRSTLFGEELFDDNLNQKPLVKFKRDIAMDISISGVI
jgi:hypothetical protein